MCGLVALLPSSRLPDPDLLRLAATRAAARGPHSFGVAAFVQATHGWRVGLGPGPLPPEALTSAVHRYRHAFVVAHARLATDSLTRGGLPDPNEGQPLIHHSGWLLAHNGTFTCPPALRYSPPSDSRLLLDLLAMTGPEQTAQRLTSLADGAPQAVLMAHPSAGVWVARVDGAHRAAHPLYRTEALLSSAPLTPTDSELLPQGLTQLCGPLILDRTRTRVEERDGDHLAAADR